MEINRPAPNFTLPDTAGKIHQLEDSRGKIVIVNFWSADCPFVERIDRDLLALLPTWRDRVVLLTVAANIHESDKTVAEEARRRSLPIVVRGSLEVVDTYAAQTTPHLFVVDENGILRYRGAFDDITFRQRIPSHFFLKEAVEALLVGKLPEVSETPSYGCIIVRHVL